MKLNMFGQDNKSGWHRKNPLTPDESSFLSILWGEHEGLENAIPAGDLAFLWLGGRDLDHEDAKRLVREMQNHLLFDHDKIPVLSRAGKGGGYWIAASKDEADEFYATFRSRGMTGFRKATRGRRAEMIDMVTQLSFEFDDLVDKTGMQPRNIMSGGGVPAPIEVVDAFLDKMTADPARFADGLRKIGQKYGGVLLPREKIVALRSEIARVQELVRELEG